MLFDQIIQNQFLNVEEILSEEDLKFYSFYLVQSNLTFLQQIIRDH